MYPPVLSEPPTSTLADKTDFDNDNSSFQRRLIQLFMMFIFIYHHYNHYY